MAKKKKGGGRILRLNTGQEFEIVSENGRYYFCRGTQFRKANTAIEKIYNKTDKLEGGQ